MLGGHSVGAPLPLGQYAPAGQMSPENQFFCFGCQEVLESAYLFIHASIKKTQKSIPIKFILKKKTQKFM